MRNGQEMYHGENSLVAASLKKANAGVIGTLNALRGGVVRMDGNCKNTMVNTRLKESLMRVAVRPDFVNAPGALFPLFEALSFSKRSTDPDEPCSFQTQSMREFLLGFVDSLDENVAMRCLVDSLYIYRDTINELTPESVELTGRLLEAEGWGKPAP